MQAVSQKGFHYFKSPKKKKLKTVPERKKDDLSRDIWI